jgi:nuclear pore complex protein Nup188
LTDASVSDLLAHPGTAFAAPNEATNSEYESRTAAIHVTPTANGEYDIKEIKEDAKWLSAQAKVNLVTALRIVAIEYQGRPASHLAGSLSIQDASNLQEASGITGAQASSFAPAIGATTDSEELWFQFEKVENRRRRLFLTYLSERRHFMTCVDYVVSVRLNKRLPIIADLPDELLSGISKPGQTTLVEDDFDVYIKALEQVLQSLAAGFTAVTDDQTLSTEDMESQWLRSYLSELAHLLSAIFHILYRRNRLFAPCGVVKEWFAMMGEYGFLDGLSGVGCKLPFFSFCIVHSGRITNHIPDTARDFRACDACQNARVCYLPIAT